jgi:uncharacterized protein GlcG (DUF336 family)
MAFPPFKTFIYREDIAMAKGRIIELLIEGVVIQGLICSLLFNLASGQPSTYEKKSLSLAIAKKMVETAEKKAMELKVPMVIAVVDESGILMLLERMEGAPIISVDVAKNKAYTAAVVRRATHTLSEIVQPGKPAFGFHTMPRIAVFGGGFPVEVDGKVVGGIGVSGGSGQEDMECARAALTVLQKGTE